ncbi:hypothetical protein EII29_04845 [Leptotrichia sp. OH3620_COT-345]|uniref:hypothetical protein n=1 Tax=Leptotrichia sp. OH3620_COT-345 TaxID=2491048 RepID=UPI000F648741|nr:hypothetical protein [Leptotrichia sp. OH3620_COT-345]RRD39853.1 hypothetical protein EII29_04845 [Leptotrichia sp. OH3620_COT-345]
MTLVGTIFFNKEKINFLFTMGEFGKKKIYLEYKGKMYDLRYLTNTFKTESFFLAIKTYYDNGTFEKHVKKVLDSPESEKQVFKFIDLVIEMQLSDKTEHNSIITKITELEVEFDEEEAKFLIIAVTGNKIVHKNENNMSFFYKKVKIELGYYSSNLNKIINLIGSYIDIKKGYRIVEIFEMSDLRCFTERKEKTLSNFEETGLFSLKHNGIIDNTVKEKLYEEIESRLNDIVSYEMLKELVEY